MIKKNRILAWFSNLLYNYSLFWHKLAQQSTQAQKLEVITPKWRAFFNSCRIHVYSWLIKALGNGILSAFWKNSLGRFFQGHCSGEKKKKKKKGCFSLNSWDLSLLTAGTHWQCLQPTVSHFAYSVPRRVPHTQRCLVYRWQGSGFCFLYFSF